MSEHPFGVGDKVIVTHFAPYRHYEVHDVSRVFKRYVVLDDGSKWQPGYSRYVPYPRHSGYSRSPTLEKSTPELVEACLRSKAIRSLTSLKTDRLEELPTETLLKALTLLKRRKDET